MKFVLQLAIVALLVGLVSSQALLQSLVPFFEGAFNHSIRELCYAGLEKREMFQELMELPFPKTILTGNNTIGRPDPSRLIVLFADARNWTTLLDSVQPTLMSARNTLWEARMFVLVEDQYFNQLATMDMLRQLFRHFGIGYWCVTAERGGTFVRYLQDFAQEAILLDGPMDFSFIYSYRRLIIQRHNTVQIQAFISFPYTFVDMDNHLHGIDIYLYEKLFVYLRLVANWEDIPKSGVSAASVVEMLTSNLVTQKVDVMITRRQIVNERLPMIVLPERMHICLVVPRSTRPALLGILWRPFTDVLWINIAVAVTFVYVVKLLAATDFSFGRRIRRILNTHPMVRFTSISIDVITFVLIESYLAQVTSFLLVHRYQRDPATLKEFFATDIPIKVLEQQKLLLSRLDPALSEAILARADIVPNMDEFSTDFAHIDSIARASFMLAAYMEAAPDNQGRKPLFVLPEPLGSVPLAYLFAPVALPLRDHLALHLSWMNAFGFMVQVNRLHHGLLLHSAFSRPTIGEDLIKLGHLEPFGVFLCVGWAVGVLIFFGERITYELQKRYRANR